MTYSEAIEQVMLHNDYVAPYGKVKSYFQNTIPLKFNYETLLLSGGLPKYARSKYCSSSTVEYLHILEK